MRNPSAEHALAAALHKFLSPLVRILLRNGIPFQIFAEWAKKAYVEEGMSTFPIEGKKQTTSRLSIITGLTRKDIHRLRNRAEATDQEVSAHYNRATRVIAGWRRDRKFSGPGGKPAPLPVEGGSRTFTNLVKKYSGDIPPRAILDELLRVGAIARLKDGRIRLVARVYVPQQSKVDKLEILGSDTADLIATIDHNLHALSRPPRFQRKVMYDNLPCEVVDTFRPHAARQSQKLLEAMDRWLSCRDRDINPFVQGKGRIRAGLGIYYFEETVDHKP